MKKPNKQLCIVIPTHKGTFDKVEQISLRQLFYVIGDRYDTYYVCPNGTDMSEGFELLPYAKEEFFDEKHFNNGDIGYNTFCMRSEFYERFKDYEYMFIYQTDSIILYNAVDKYLQMGYDYYGAPLKHCEEEALCGGFSIRRIDKCLKLCKFFEQPEFDVTFYKRSGFKNEDMFFSMCLPKLLPYHLSAAFSWSCFVGYKEKLVVTNGKMPMGLHGVKKIEEVKIVKNFIRKEVAEKYGIE